jgi:hypothetical protein
MGVGGDNSESRRLKWEVAETAGGLALANNLV